MRTNLEDDPAIISLGKSLKLPPDHVVGKLHRLWSWADAHTVNGHVRGVDCDWIDRYCGKRGFSVALSQLQPPWLVIEDSGVSIPHFDRWFGTSAKRRLMDTRRKQTVRNLSAECPHDERTKTGPPYQTIPDRRVIAPALGGASLDEARTKAREVVEKLGKCGTEKNRQVLLAACVMSRELGEKWLNDAVRDTREAHPQKPYSYLRSILDRTAGEVGVDFDRSVSSMDFSANGAQP